MSANAPAPTTPAADLFGPVQLGDLALANRIVMAPLTRNRAAPGLLPSPLAAEYYGQRATAGLIITEATQVSVLAQGYLDTPGIYTDAQVAAWKQVTDEVHARGGRIVMQLWHVGRISHASLLPAGEQPVAPSAIAADAKTYTADGFQQVSAPRALTAEEIPAVVDDFRRAAANAIAAGFDGVEVHGANGYLIDQFLRSGSNHRTDGYGGDIAARTRFLFEVVQAVAGEIGAGRTGVRLSPATPFGDSHDDDPQALFEHAIARLSPLGLAYVHIIEGATGGDRGLLSLDYAAMRAKFAGPWMVNNGYSGRMAADTIAHGDADAVAFGRPFISNPDLVRRLREDAPLAPMDSATMYGGGATGYTDYPTLDKAEAATAA